LFIFFACTHKPDEILLLYVCMKCHETWIGLLVVHMIDNWMEESSNLA